MTTVSSSIKPKLLCITLGTLVAGTLVAQTAPSRDARSVTEEALVLSPFEVVSENDGSYYSSNVISGTKVATPLKELPISLQVITEEFMNDLAATNLDEALGYAAAVDNGGVSDNGGAGNNAFYGTNLRGIRNNYQLQDGFRRYSQPNTSAIARVEVIKGPSSVLYGYTQPGGIVNAITKRPSQRRRIGINQTIGTDSYRRTAVDYNQPITKAATTRFNAVYQHRTQWRDYQSNREKGVHNVNHFRFSEKTTATVSVDFTETDNNTAIGVPAFGNALGNVGLGGNVPLHETYGVPLAFNPRGPDDKQIARTTMVSAFLDHRFTRNLSFRLSVLNQSRSMHTERPEALNVRFAPNSGNRVIEYTSRWQRVENQNHMFNATADLIYKFNLPKAKNQILAGIQYYNDGFKHTVYWDQDPALAAQQYLPSTRLPDQLQPNGTWGRLRSLMQIAPVFTYNSDILSRPSGLNYVYRPHESRFDKSIVNAAYVTAQTKLLDEKLIFFGGAYHSEFDRVNAWRLAIDSRPQVAKQNPKKTNPQVGALYQFTDWIGVFGLYSESLFGTTGQGADSLGNTFEPELGRSFEAGIKLDFPGQKVVGTVSAFRINQRNKVENDPNADNAVTRSLEAQGIAPNLNQFGDDLQVDEISSEGFDADLIVSPLPRWQIVLGYAYVHRTVTDNTAFVKNAAANNRNVAFQWQLGTRTPGIPLNKVTSFTRYTFAREGALRGLSVGGGLRWTDKRLRQFRTAPSTSTPNPNPVSAPAWNKAFFSSDIFASYSRKLLNRQVNFRFNVRNLLEDKFVVGFKPYSNEGYYYPTPREFIFSVGFEL